ncbi:MAG: hypothetical protein ABIB47_06120 [Candidatus Woesearchaeota archaeon]
MGEDGNSRGKIFLQYIVDRVWEDIGREGQRLFIDERFRASLAGAVLRFNSGLGGEVEGIADRLEMEFYVELGSLFETLRLPVGADTAEFANLVNRVYGRDTGYWDRFTRTQSQ